MPRTADAVVIGTGIVGTTVGLELARQGLNTVLIDDRAEAGRGATSTASGLVRSFHGTRPAVALAYESRSRFAAWSDYLGISRPKAKFEKVGCALLVPSKNTRVGETIERLLRAIDVPVESLAGREANTLVPGMRAAGTRVLFESGGGFVSSTATAARDVQRAAEAAGATCLLGDPVVAIRTELRPRFNRRRILGLDTASGIRIDTPVVVNAAGPRAAYVNLLARAPLALNTVPVVHRVIRGHLTGDAPRPVVVDVAGGFYVRFEADGFRLGALSSSRADIEFLTDPTERPPKVSRTFIAERQRAFQRRHPKVRWRDARVQTGVHDLTVLDGYPIVDRGSVDGLYVAAGTSGCWFGAAPALGWVLSELILAVEAGRDHDQNPLKVTLPSTGQPFDVGFLGRNRTAIQPEADLGVLG